MSQIGLVISTKSYSNEMVRAYNKSESTTQKQPCLVFLDACWIKYGLECI